MRESVGGAWLFGIVIVFVFFFAGFLAYSINYTKAFNVKNEIVNYIEHLRGFSKFDSTGGRSIEVETDERVLNETVEGKMYQYIQRVGYNHSAVDPSVCSDGKGEYYWGSCIYKVCSNNNKYADTYYKVTTFINFTIPVVNLTFTIPIVGETGSLYLDVGIMECSN